MARADPRHPPEYHFLDEALDAQYRSELGLTKLIGIFAGVSILIACMGLFGLAAFTTEQRSREIGTRKVLGASSWQIVTLLARRILVLVLIAAMLAAVGRVLRHRRMAGRVRLPRRHQSADLHAGRGHRGHGGFRHRGAAVVEDRQRDPVEALRHV